MSIFAFYGQVIIHHDIQTSILILLYDIFYHSFDFLSILIYRNSSSNVSTKSRSSAALAPTLKNTTNVNNTSTPVEDSNEIVQEVESENESEALGNDFDHSNSEKKRKTYLITK